MRQARALQPGPGVARSPAVQQAALLIEVGRRVLEPAQPLPPGDTTSIALPLYRSAIEHLRGAGVAPVEDVGGASNGDDVPRLRRFAESLLREATGRPRQVDLLLAQRWLRMLLCGVVLAAAVVGARAALARPDLAKGKRFWTSSSWVDCLRDPPCTVLMFHTNEQYNPWVEIDLGAPKVIRQIEVQNRGDCCSERSVPLVAEVSKDGNQWTEVSRRTKEFVSWTARFRPATARYVRLRVPRVTTLHLQSVAVR